jgi:calpain-7
MYPYNSSQDRPEISANGRYVFRFHFNGSDRLVEIDDRLPVSQSHRMLHVMDRNCPGLLWPALLEKAYLKLRAGGYEWDGSNAASDLSVITGWIPELVLLQE